MRRAVEFRTRQANASQIRPPPIGRMPAGRKSRTVQLTSFVKCMATAGAISAAAPSNQPNGRAIAHTRLISTWVMAMALTGLREKQTGLTCRTDEAPMRNRRSRRVFASFQGSASPT